MPLVWLAMRGLRSSRTFVLLVLAITLATGFAISNAANLAGFETSLLEDGLAHSTGDVRIWPRDRQRLGGADVAAVAELGDAVPLLTFPGAVAGADRRFVTAAIWGVDATVQRPPFRLVAGTSLRTGASPHPEVLLGAAVAAQLDAHLGDDIELRAIVGPRDVLLGLPNTLALRGHVSGLVSGTRGGNHAVFLDRAVLGEAAGTSGAVSMIALHLADHDLARAVAIRIEANHPDLEARAWNDDDPGLISFLDMRRAIGGISNAMVIAAIAIPMAALLYIYVLRKQRELAILSALGFSRGDLFAVCVLQSTILAVVGGALGAWVGYGLTRYFVANPVFEWSGLRVLPRLTGATFIVPIAVIVSASLVAALYPAWRAARIDPATVLRRIE